MYYYEYEYKEVDVRTWVIRIILIGILISLIVIAYYLYMMNRSMGRIESRSLAVIKLVDDHVKCLTSGRILYLLNGEVYKTVHCRRGMILKLSRIYCIAGRNAVICG